MSERRHIWAGRELATHQDLSQLSSSFARRELYLREGGRLAMVLPNAAVDRKQYEGFRSGNYSGKGGTLYVAFNGSWDLRRIRPHFFPRGASVVFAKRSSEPIPLGEAAEIWSGRLNGVNCSWAHAKGVLDRRQGTVKRGTGVAKSPFAERFTQGATFAPRLAFLVSKRPAGPLGLPAGRISMISSRSANEKMPYKALPSIEGVVETEFVRPVYAGENLLPYRVVDPLLAVVPCSSTQILGPREIDLYPGLRSWWEHAQAVWEVNRASPRLSLMDQLDYQAKLTKQLPIPRFRVIYNASGMHLAAAKVRNERAIISKSLYWAAFRDEDEADFLCAILNSAAITDFLRPLMSYGKDERHIDKHLWELPIPAYASSDRQHRELVACAREVATLTAAYEIDPAVHFSASRRRLRKLIEGSPSGARISDILFEMLS